MDPTIQNADPIPPRLKVSVIARLIAALSFVIPAIGAAVGSLVLTNVFRALRASETAGIGSVMAGMKESSLPVIASLYIAALCGLVVIVTLVVRMIIDTKTASPPFWFFVLVGVLCFVPAAFFWKAQLLVLEVLSPGSSIGAAGIGGVGAEISTLLLASMIAAPIVFLILIAASVIPFSSRPGPKVISLIVALLIEGAIVATAVGVPFLIDAPKRKNEMVNLPSNVKYTDIDADIEKEASLVLTLTADNKLYQRESHDVSGRSERAETAISFQELPAKISAAMETKTPDKRIVYLKSDTNAGYENVVKVFDAVSKSDVDKVGLVVVGEKGDGDPYQIAPAMFEISLIGPPNDPSTPVRPNPLTLVVSLEADGKIKLNSVDTGTISDPDKLESQLISIFKDRESNGVFREGTNEVEKTVSVNTPGSAKYGDFIKLIQALRAAGASPIGVRLDDVNR